jgi:hypothetical protein
MAGIGSWENLPGGNDQIVIAIPHVGIVTFEWAVHFKVLQPPVPFTIIANRGLPIDRARCDLVLQAKRMGASHIFFLDSDVCLPPDGLIRLYNWHLPIVCGIYGSKHESPGVWIEQAKSGDARYAPILPEVLDANPLFTHPDLVVGAGCCLIDLKVFDRLKEPYFEWTQGRIPGGVSEDFYFFERVRELNIPIHVDPAVKCKHIDFCSLTWEGKRERLQL